MAENKHQLLVTIGAALSSGFNSVISGSSSKIKGVGSVIKDLEKQSVVSGAAINKLKTRYNSLLGSLNKQQEIISKRGFYRSQILEVAALGAALAAPIKSAMAFEKSLAGIKAVVDFKTTDGLQKLGEVLTQMSREMPVTADELANIAAVGGRFGIAQEKLAEFSKEVGKTAVAWGVPVKDMSERVGNLMKVFGTGLDQLPEYYNAVNLLGNKTGATADDISKAITASSDGLANFKLSIPQAAALNSTIISFGESAEQAGSAVSNMLQKLSIAPQLGATAQKALRDMGLSSVTLPKMIQEDPQKVLDKLFEGVSKLNPEKRSTALYAIFGRGAAKTVGKLVDNLELYRKNLALVANQKLYEGSRDGDYQIVFETAESQLKMLGNTFTAFTRVIGNSLLPAFKNIVSGINGVLAPVIAWMEKNKELAQTITTGIAGLVGFRIATFALGYASTFLFGGLNRLVIAFKGLRLAMSFVGVAFRSFLGWPALLAGAALLIYKNWDTVKEFLLNIWGPVKETWGVFKNKMDELGITDFIMNAWIRVRDFFANIWGAVSPHFDAFINKINQLGFVQKIVEAWKKVEEFFLQLWKDITPSVDKIIAPFTNLWGKIKGGMPNIGGLISGKTEPTLKLPNTKELTPNMARNQNNNFSITINANKNDNSETIANKVMNRVQDYSKTFLFDEVAV